MTDYRGLPKEYTQVEYIESSGSQYINTGFVPNSNTRVVMDVMLVKQTVASKAIFGARSASSGTDSGSFTFLSIETGAKTRSDYFGSSVAGNFPILGKRVVIDRDKNVCNVDGNVITNKTSANKCSVNMYLFAVNTANSAVLQSNLKLYSCQIYDNGTLKLDFVPAKRVSDNVIGMYDMVSKTFFTNAGTGVFTAGEEVKKPVAAYVGVLSDITLPINSTNFYEYFEYKGTDGIDFKPTSDGTVSFYYSDRYRPGSIEEYEYVWTSLKKCTLRFDYNVWGEAAEFSIDGVSQMIGSKSYTKELDIGDTVTFYMAVNISRAGETNLSINITNAQVISSTSVARKITNAYVGAASSVQLTESNVETYFDTSNEHYNSNWGTAIGYYWWIDGQSNWVAKDDLNISFDYNVYGFKQYGTFEFCINSIPICRFDVNKDYDGIKGSWSGKILKGEIFFLSYRTPEITTYAPPSGIGCTLTNIQISTPSMPSVARKIKKAYIGVPTQIPIYEERETTTTKDVETLITPSNISNFFTRAGNSYTFVGDSSGKFTSINQGAHSTTAKSTWTAKKQIKKLTFSYKVSSESNYDKYSITVGGTIVANNISGNGSNQTYSGSLSSGGAIVLQYSKDGSTSSYDDCGTIWDIKVTTAETVTTTEKVQVGTETKEVARLCYQAPPSEIVITEDNYSNYFNLGDGYADYFSWNKNNNSYGINDNPPFATMTYIGWILQKSPSYISFDYKSAGGSLASSVLIDDVSHDLKSSSGSINKVLITNKIEFRVAMNDIPFRISNIRLKPIQ